MFSSAGGLGSIFSQHKLYPTLCFLAGLVMPGRDAWRSWRSSRSYPAPFDLDTTHGRRSVRARLRQAGFTKERLGLASIDVRTALDVESSFLRRIVFADTEESLCHITLLNLIGFRGSRYGGHPNEEYFAWKLGRNRRIAQRNRVALAALVDAANPDVYLGFTAVVPLNAEGVRRYFSSPGVSDNEITEDMVARAGQTFDTLLLFAIASVKLFRGRYELRDIAPPGSKPAPIDSISPVELLRVLTLQVALICSTGRAEEDVRLVGQSAVPSVQRLFGQLGMQRREDISTADGEPCYSALLQVRNRQECVVKLDEGGRIVALE